MSKIKRNLSLEEDILAKGLIRAKELGYNFSSYVTYLINLDCSKKEITEEEIEKIKNDRNTDKLDKKIMGYADDIINGNI